VVTAQGRPKMVILKPPQPRREQQVARGGFGIVLSGAGAIEPALGPWPLASRSLPAMKNAAKVLAEYR
jgi:hypothetical protein